MVDGRTLYNILMKPREAIEELVQSNSKAYFWLIVATGIGIRLDQAANNNIGDRVPTDYILLTGLILGPLMGLIAWIFYSGLTQVMVRVFGGNGTWGETRKVFAWGSTPLVIKLFLWVPELILFGGAMFTSQFLTGFSFLFFSLFGLLELILTLWFFWIVSQGLSEIHGISAWKGFWSVILLPVALTLLLILTVIVIV